MLKSYALGSGGVNDKVCVPISPLHTFSGDIDAKLGYCVAPLPTITRIALICHGQGYPFFQVWALPVQTMAKGPGDTGRSFIFSQPGTSVSLNTR